MDSYTKARIKSPSTGLQILQTLQGLLPGLLLGLTTDQGDTTFSDTLQKRELDFFIRETAALELSERGWSDL